MKFTDSYYAPDEKLLFVTGTQFTGSRGSDNTSFSCRFAITRMKASGSLVAHPEVLMEDTGQWRPARPASWMLDDILDSQGLWLDFGSRRTIEPTEEVWQEIRTRLNELQTA